MYRKESNDFVFLWTYSIIQPYFALVKDSSDSVLSIYLVSSLVRSHQKKKGQNIGGIDPKPWRLCNDLLMETSWVYSSLLIHSPKINLHDSNGWIQHPIHIFSQIKLHSHGWVFIIDYRKNATNYPFYLCIWIRLHRIPGEMKLTALFTYVVEFDCLDYLERWIQLAPSLL